MADNNPANETIHQTAQDEGAPLLASSTIKNGDGSEKNRRYYIVLAQLLLCIMIVESGAMLEVPSITQVLEDAVCQRQYLGSGTSPEHMNCHTEEITSEVALLNGIMDALNYAPGIALALPMGVLADRFGRKPVLSISFVGLMLSETWVRAVLWWWNIFPTRLVWLTTIGPVLGGGVTVLSATVYTIVADITPPNERLNIFYLGMACLLGVGTIFGTLGASIVSSGHPWIAYMASYAMKLVSCCLAFFLPESLKQPIKATTTSHDDDEPSTPPSSFMNRITISSKKWLSSTKFIWKSRNVSLILSTFSIYIMVMRSMVLLILFTSRKFHRSIGDASFLLPLLTTSNLAALLIMPIVSRIMETRFHIPSQRKDWIVSIWQLVLDTVGMLLITWSPKGWVLFIGVAMSGLGAGVHASLRSLVTSLVHQNNYATLYGAIAAIQSLGSVSTGPLMAFVFGKDISLPFWIMSALFGAALVAVCAVSLPRDEGVEDSAED